MLNPIVPCEDKVTCSVRYQSVHTSVKVYRAME